ncbi:hypothetical protein GCM10027049_12620 [Mucilaginibacter puniceus]
MIVVIGGTHLPIAIGTKQLDHPLFRKRGSELLGSNNPLSAKGEERVDDPDGNRETSG